jgi:hypothetical protein
MEGRNLELLDFCRGSFDRQPFGHGAQQQIIRARLSDRG